MPRNNIHTLDHAPPLPSRHSFHFRGRARLRTVPEVGPGRHPVSVDGTLHHAVPDDGTNQRAVTDRCDSRHLVSQSWTKTEVEFDGRKAFFENTKVEFDGNSSSQTKHRNVINDSVEENKF